jgi:hypothetical protein
MVNPRKFPNAVRLKDSRRIAAAHSCKSRSVPNATALPAAQKIPSSPPSHAAKVANQIVWVSGLAPPSSILTTETVQGPALSLQSVDNIERGDGLALGVLGVCDGVTDDALEEGLQDTSGLLVDH